MLLLDHSRRGLRDTIVNDMDQIKVHKQHEDMGLVWLGMYLSHYSTITYQNYSEAHLQLYYSSVNSKLIISSVISQRVYYQTYHLNSRLAKQ